MRNFRQLEVWRKAHALRLDVYRITADFPQAERYGLSSQIQRAATSMGANLAEGCGRDTDADFRKFVLMASGSACEVEYHMILTKDLELISVETNETQNKAVNEVKRMLLVSLDISKRNAKSDDDF